jgi:hypothetical protein
MQTEKLLREYAKDIEKKLAQLTIGQRREAFLRQVELGLIKILEGKHGKEKDQEHRG